MIRENEEAVMNLFKTITLKDKDGKEHQVRTIYANGEKAEAVVSREVIKENVAPGVDKICLPMISFSLGSLCRSHMAFKGTIHALYRQGLNGIIEKLFVIEKDMQDRINGEGRFVLGRFIFDEGQNDKQMQVQKAKFNFYFYTK